VPRHLAPGASTLTDRSLSPTRCPLRRVPGFLEPQHPRAVLRGAFPGPRAEPPQVTVRWCSFVAESTRPAPQRSPAAADVSICVPPSKRSAQPHLSPQRTAANGQAAPWGMPLSSLRILRWARPRGVRHSSNTIVRPRALQGQEVARAATVAGARPPAKFAHEAASPQWNPGRFRKGVVASPRTSLGRRRTPGAAAAVVKR
jgi:hypothetical protein